LWQEFVREGHLLVCFFGKKVSIYTIIILVDILNLPEKSSKSIVLNLDTYQPEQILPFFG